MPFLLVPWLCLRNSRKDFSGTQTERQGLPWPVRGLLGGRRRPGVDDIVLPLQGSKVPKHDGRIDTAGCHRLTIGRDRQTFDLSCVALNHREHLVALELAHSDFAVGGAEDNLSILPKKAGRQNPFLFLAAQIRRLVFAGSRFPDRDASIRGAWIIQVSGS
jgi:hypothetical protein